MKHLKFRYINLCLIAAATLLLTSCVNYIQEDAESEEKEPTTSGNIPIRISTQILSVHTQVRNTNFKNNDAVGLYVLTDGQNLNNERHVDNARFICTSSTLIPDKEIYFPQGGGSCNFVSYYPHQELGVQEGESSIDISINPNQSTPTAYNCSDFMTASVADIAPTKNVINLNYYHRLCQLNIILKPTSDDNLEEIKKSASVMISNAFTKATYEFGDNEFTALSTPKEITPNGTWSIDTEKHKLTGKKALLIPQSTDNLKVILRINGRTFSASLPDNLILASNTSSEITLHCNTQIGIDEIVPSIGEWQEGSKSDVDLEEEKKNPTIDIANLNFEQTHVHHIVNNSNTVIAEVCKEYLVSEGIDAQAIVLYPANNKTEGTVLQVLNKSEDVHGGTVLWNLAENLLTYTPGNKAPISSIYIDSDGELSLEKPAESSQSIASRGYMLTDRRGLEVNSYPIVKIGTQYWMRENLNTTLYNTGAPITKITNPKQTTAGYQMEGGNRFYNKAAVIRGILPPIGWKIPSAEEWGSLKTYIDNRAALLKSGNQWESFENITPANNLTGFKGEPIGLFSKSQESSMFFYKYQYVVYWSMGSSPTTLASTGVMLKFDNDNAKGANYNDNCSYSIRCIKE